MRQDELRIADIVCPLVPALAGTGLSTPALARKSDGLVDIPALNALALQSLKSLYEPSKNLFVRCVTWSANGAVHREQPSPKRTAIALLGLQQLAKAGSPLPFDLSALTAAVLGDTSWVASIADLGLLIWLTATLAPDELLGLFVQFDFTEVIQAYPDGWQASTRSLAWFLTGLSYAHLADSAGVPDLTGTAANAYHLLLENQAESGLFGHAAFPGLLAGLCSKRFGTFSDQIYAICALATFTSAFQVDEPLEPALRAANSIRALQGELGEWWFLYDKRSSSVVSHYPVLCCHQGGTAPMGLIAVEEATGQCFREAIGRGVSWIAGANALQDDLRSSDRGLIWDSIRACGRRANAWDVALHLLHVPRRSRNDQLRISYEVRPDHYGWLLYAFGKAGISEMTTGTAVTGEAG